MKPNQNYFSPLLPSRVFSFCFRGGLAGARFFLPLALWLCAAGNLFAQTNTTPAAVLAPNLPNAGASLLRVLGALALVLGLFLAGVWFFKNWQRLSMQRGAKPKLNILETRSLGARQAVFVVGYEKQRFLVATSTAGMNLLSHLPDAEIGETEAGEKTAAPLPFAQALAQVLKGK